MCARVHVCVVEGGVGWRPGHQVSPGPNNGRGRLPCQAEVAQRRPHIGFFSNTHTPLPSLVLYVNNKGYGMEHLSNLDTQCALVMNGGCPQCWCGRWRRLVHWRGPIAFIHMCAANRR